jgi:hypothetical protein
MVVVSAFGHRWKTRRIKVYLMVVCPESMKTTRQDESSFVIYCKKNSLIFIYKRLLAGQGYRPSLTPDISGSSQIYTFARAAVAVPAGLADIAKIARFLLLLWLLLLRSVFAPVLAANFACHYPHLVVCLGFAFASSMTLQFDDYPS